MNKLTDFQKRMFVLGVGVLMVLIGMIQAIFKPPFLITYRKMINEVTFILMMVAAMLLFSIKRKPASEPEDQNKLRSRSSRKKSKRINWKRKSKGLTKFFVTHLIDKELLRGLFLYSYFFNIEA